MNFIDKKTQRYSERDCIVIAGSGRSGTTWVAETLSSKPNITLIHEPLKNTNSRRIQKIGFTGWGQHIPENENWNEAKKFFDDLLSGGELNPNYFLGIPLKNIADTERWLVKFVRAPFMLNWLTVNYDLIPPVYIIRNPYAVISSQLRHGNFGKKGEFNATKQSSIPEFEHYNEFYQEHFALTPEVRNDTESVALHWCIQNKYVLTHPNAHKNWKIKYYEDLVMNPLEEFADLETHFDLNSEIALGDIKIESSSTVSKVDFDDPILQLTKWQKHLPIEDIKSISRIMKLTDFEIYSPDVPTAIPEKIESYS